jgi:CheY-like chemotaxis protein
MSRCLHEWLEGAGYDVEEWQPRSVAEVQDHLLASPPDLILSDFQMPGCNGATLARMARTIVPDTPVLILTAFRTREMERELLKLGVRRVLTKPIRGEALTYAVMGALAEPARSS